MIEDDNDDDNYVIRIKGRWSGAQPWYVIEKGNGRETTCNYLDKATVWSLREATKEANRWEKADRIVEVVKLA